MAEVAVPRHLFADMPRANRRSSQQRNEFDLSRFREKPWKTRVLMTEVSACPTRDSEPGRPETYLQATTGSPRHFSLVEALLWPQP